MEIMEILFVLAVAGGMLLPPLLFKQFRLFFVFLVFFLIFGLMEWLSVAQTDMSISQHFWVLNSENPAGAWIVIIGMAIGWLALLYHLISRKRSR
jgi:hypothetical protein